MKVYRDYQTATDSIQERGHGPTQSIDIYARRELIKLPPERDCLAVSILDRLLHQAPATVWLLGIREIA